MQKTVAKISLSTIEKNATYWKKRTGVRLCAVVKDDAYGHGAAEAAACLHEIADCFAVANVDEAAALKTVTDKDILVLTPPCNEIEAREIALRGCIMCVDSAFTACAAASAAAFVNHFSHANGVKNLVRVHLKVNTGMNRFGASGAAFTRVCKILKNSKAVRVEGVFSHLAGIEKTENAYAQRESFVKYASIAERYFGTLIKHLSATCGACLSEEYYFDMVRIGLGLYGYLPKGCLPLVGKPRSKTADGANVAKQYVSPVRPAMKVFARCIESRTYAGGVLGYGEREGKRGEKLHVVNAGYGAGFFRREENGADGGKNAAPPCMDCTIRYGTQPRGKEICVMKNAESVAEKCGTIAYEVLCAVASRAERVYI